MLLPPSGYRLQQNKRFDSSRQVTFFREAKPCYSKSLTPEMLPPMSDLWNAWPERKLSPGAAIESRQRRTIMAFASQFEYQDELEELELLDFEDAPVDWKTRDWFQFHRFEDGHFEVRVSGFGLGAD